MLPGVGAVTWIPRYAQSLPEERQRRRDSQTTGDCLRGGGFAMTIYLASFTGARLSPPKSRLRFLAHESRQFGPHPLHLRLLRGLRVEAQGEVVLVGPDCVGAVPSECCNSTLLPQSCRKELEVLRIYVVRSPPEGPECAGQVAAEFLQARELEISGVNERRRSILGARTRESRRSSFSTGTFSYSGQIPWHPGAQRRAEPCRPDWSPWFLHEAARSPAQMCACHPGPVSTAR